MTDESAPTNPEQTAAKPTPGPVAHPPPTRRSVWTPKEKLTRLVWSATKPLRVLLPALTPPLLRAFGGACGANCTIAGSVEITIPWNVTLGNRVRIRERAILYALGPLSIGDDSLIDARAHLCAGTHDITDSTFPLVKPPITIGERCLVGIDAYLGPYVELADDCRVWPRASVYKSFPAGTHLRGNPAKPIEPNAPDEAGPCEAAP